jgi:hypothetical protein
LPRYLKLLAFLAAMHSRTPSRRDHFMGFWSEVLQMGEEIEHQMKVATPEERRRVASYAAPDDSNRPTMSLDDVRKIRANPMQHTLEPLMAAEFPLLTRMRCFVLCTASEIGFITSDAPVVWFDPEWHRKPPLYRSACFSDPELEITLPLSPMQMLVLKHGEANTQRLVEYVEVPDKVVSELNRRTRSLCANEFIVRIQRTELRWFEQGTMPADAWELNEGKNLDRTLRPHSKPRPNQAT